MAIGLGLLAASLGVSALGLSQVTQATLSPPLFLWTVLPLLGVPMALAVAYRLFGLATAIYSVDRDTLSVRWGWAEETARLSDVTLQTVPETLRSSLRPGRGLWWPGCLVGVKQIPDVGTVEFFASRPAGGMLLVFTGNKTLAISPPNPQAFVQAFVAATRMGSLRKTAIRSVRPEFFTIRIWEDGLARILILLGLALPLALLGYLGVVSAGLPNLVPFGFDIAGQPGPMVPPTRLLFLPLIGVMCWLTDMVLAGVIYRVEKDRPLAYGTWALAVAVGILLWGAAVQLVSAA